jgi:putative transposase
LERVRCSYRLHVYGYVIMPQHVHLLLSEPQQDKSSDRTAPLKPKGGLNGPPALSELQQDTLADALKSLKQGVSRRLIGNLPLKPKSGLSGAPEHFWQKRYYDFNIRNYPQFVEKLRYIHRNR